MKKATNTRRTSSNVMNQETEEYEPPSISSKHVAPSFCGKYDNYYLSATRYTSKSKKKPACECFVQMCTHRATISGNSGNDHEKQMPSNAGRSGAGRPNHTDPYWGPSIAGIVFDFSTLSPKEPLVLPHQTQRRKKHQRLQRENQSATTIQAVWRGYRVRREVDEMNKAATRIQAAYRSHRTRQQLPLAFYSYFGHKKFALNRKKEAESKAMAGPAVSKCHPYRGRGLQAPGDTSENESLRAPHRERHDPSSFVIPRALIFKRESSLTLSNEVLAPANRPSPACEVFQALAPEQQNHDAADNIQAARRGNQSRKELSKMARQATKTAEQSQILAYSNQCRPNSHENYQISRAFNDANIQVLTQEPQDVVQYPELDPVVMLGLSKGSRESNAEGNAPSIRNVNVYSAEEHAGLQKVLNLPPGVQPQCNSGRISEGNRQSAAAWAVHRQKTQRLEAFSSLHSSKRGGNGNDSG